MVVSVSTSVVVVPEGPEGAGAEVVGPTLLMVPLGVETGTELTGTEGYVTGTEGELTGTDGTELTGTELTGTEG